MVIWPWHGRYTFLVCRGAPQPLVGRASAMNEKLSGTDVLALDAVGKLEQIQRIEKPPFGALQRWRSRLPSTSRSESPRCAADRTAYQRAVGHHHHPVADVFDIVVAYPLVPCRSFGYGSRRYQRFSATMLQHAGHQPTSDSQAKQWVKNSGLHSGS